MSINTLLLNIFGHFLQKHCKDEFFRGTDQRILQADHRNPVDAVPPMVKYDTVMILSFRTDMPGQAVQTQVRMLLEEQSDQGLH